ncbi:TPA: hypothetical protein PRY95_004112 [Escherichia coli]|uniref:hypothetical protein n=1 Tax=Klebsiella oxytoca TaxID=571 RepID=UPI00224628B9|nr:hypothetical protein [Klebsiella oxytoca]HDK2410994.1 hypothetical protein [Escherichia coli]MCW9591557.1 hypothetical protein [Klebsiella oxytoca]MCW9603023.1 hypothetical protein [Klebsiella oxytoca]MCW9625554.1 hypothetical protein [Klebsiella oxytoca]HDK2415557.1 hypothetical protein [Escherichia coli]
MNTYLSSLHKRLGINPLQQSEGSSDTKDIYLPYTQELANKIKTWINHLDTENHDRIFYECDLCKAFKCNKEDLAIAAENISLYSRVKNINGVKIRYYTATQPSASLQELTDVQQFIFKCLRRGYISTQKNGWCCIIPSVNLYKIFANSEEYRGTNRTSFGRNLSKMGIAKSILAGNPPYRCRSFKFKSLNEARISFANEVLNDRGYKWE